MPRAIVTGATGINDIAILQALSAEHKYTLSHAPPSSTSKIKHTPINLLTSPSEISSQLKSQFGTSNGEDIYVFCNAYMEKLTEEETVDVNGRILRNFIEGLRVAGLKGYLKRMVLTTGTKYYGDLCSLFVHLVMGMAPAEETDPRVDDPTHPPNFYYIQEDTLRDEAKDRNWGWVICMPNDIIGYAHGNYMNIVSALATYATVCYELNEPLLFSGGWDLLYWLGQSQPFEAYGWHFPFCEEFWRGGACWLTLIYVEFEIWAALAPQTSNQLLNVASDGPATWATNWPRLATYFNACIPPDQFSRPAPLPSGTPLPLASPIEAYANIAGLVGRIPRVALENRVDPVKWSQRPEVKDAWKKIANRSGGKVRSDWLEKATWGFASFVLRRPCNIVISVVKARELGWKGWGSTWGAYKGTFDELVEKGVVPKPGAVSGA